MLQFVSSPPEKGSSDFTSQFLQACDALHPEEVVKGAGLSMMDAMNALVMMDPRMDSGFRSPSIKTVHAESSRSAYNHTPLKDDKEVLEDISRLDLNSEGICGIMDRLLELEMTYHDGAPLVQTIFLSRHFLQLYSLTLLSLPSNPTVSDLLLYHVLIPYLHSLRLSMYLVWTELTRGNVFDGEDFFSDPSGLWDRGKEWTVPRLGRMENADEGEEETGLGGMLGSAECDWMLEDVAERTIDGLRWLERSGLQIEELVQIKTRVEFRQTFLSHLVVVLAPSYDTLPLTYPLQPIRPALDNLIHSIRTRPSPSPSLVRTMALAFDNRVHRRFRQMMPLCQTDILTDQQLEQRLGDMVEGITVCERLANEPDPSVWQRELISLAMKERPTLAFIRSAVMSNLTPTPHTLFTGLSYPKEFISERFLKTEAGIGLGILSDWEETMALESPAYAKKMREWNSRLTGYLISDTTLLLHNTPRTRRLALNSMKIWEEMALTIPVHRHMRPEDAPRLRAAMARKRWECALFGWLWGFENEIWGTGIVGVDERGRSRPGGRADALASAWWWLQIICEEYKKVVMSHKDWRTVWIASWHDIAGAVLCVLATIDKTQNLPDSKAIRQQRQNHFAVRFKHFVPEAKPLLGDAGFRRAKWQDWEHDWKRLRDKVTSELVSDAVSRFDSAMLELDYLHKSPQCGSLQSFIDTVATELKETIVPALRSGRPLRLSMRSLKVVQNQGLRRTVMCIPDIRPEHDVV